MKQISLFIALVFLLTSCEIVNETTFEKNGSGTNKFEIDLSSMSSFGDDFSSTTDFEHIDTLLYYKDVLKTHKDSIAKLSSAERKELQKLEDFTFGLHIDSSTNEFKFNVVYDFDDVDDLKSMGELLENINIDNLGLMSSEEKDEKSSSSKNKQLPDLNSVFDISFSKKKFKMSLDQKAYEKSDLNIENSDDTMFLKMIDFKLRYRFPYRVVSVSNENVTILSDLKGIEFVVNSDNFSKPEFFDIEVEFGK